MRVTIYSSIPLALLFACHHEEAKKVDDSPAIALSGDSSEGNGGGEQEPELVPDDEENSKDWKPAEHQNGMGRWKDTGVYVDGKPVGVLSFGELPIDLAPVWVEDKVSAPKHPGTNEPGYRIVSQRNYRFTDYFAAVGVNLKKVKEVHVYGGRPSDVMIVSGEELRRRGKDFLFRFGGEVWGKAIPVTPEHFGNGKSPDKISSVLVYCEKKPPTLVRNVGMELDGKIVTGVPYYGEPMRGGVRVYFNDRLAAVIKRKALEDPHGASLMPDGSVRFSLFEFLKAQGVDTKKIVEGWVVYDEKRIEKIGRAELEKTSFEASPQAHGEIQLVDADKKIVTSALALHTKPIRADQLPQIRADEDSGI